jgi:hypothetical protein
MDGRHVSNVYWQEKNLSRIVEYCRKDVITLAQLMLRFKSEPLLTSGDIIILDNA